MESISIALYGALGCAAVKLEVGRVLNQDHIAGSGANVFSIVK
jgi:hypothetical protein